MAQTETRPARAPDPNHRVDTERSPRWVRVRFNGETIVDTRNALLLMETGTLPVYYFPPEDVRMDLMTPTERHTTCPYKGEASYWTIKVGDREAENTVWSYLDPLPAHPEIKGHVAFYWNRVDAWYEEEEQIYAHPRDPYHRVDALPSNRNVRIVVGGETIAETDHPHLLFETSLPTRHYIPREDARMELLEPTDKHTRCPYKGEASYFTVRAGGQEYPDLVWSYPDPIAECPKIKHLLAFYNEKVDVYVDGELQERPKTKWS